MESAYYIQRNDSLHTPELGAPPGKPLPRLSRRPNRTHICIPQRRLEHLGLKFEGELLVSEDMCRLVHAPKGEPVNQRHCSITGLRE